MTKIETDRETDPISVAAGFTFTEHLQHVVQAACLAPSVHNTQPWKFVARPSGLDLYLDPTRRLRYLDPDGRQQHLSCGAALFHARASARALGLDVTVRLLPDPFRPLLLAELDLAEGAPATADEVWIATAILHRHTFRGAFDPGPLPVGLLDDLGRRAEAEGASLLPVTDDRLIDLEVLLAHADADEEHDARYRRELHEWLRDEPDAPDGIPRHSAVVAGSSLRQRDFSLSHPECVDGSEPVPDRPAVVVLTTERDDRESWLRAGQALAVVLLAAADQEVQAQPLGQVTDLTGYRVRLRAALGLVGVPQLVLRMGHGQAEPTTSRRPVEEVLIDVSG